MPQPRALPAASAELLWHRAETAYAESRYAEAARLYARLCRLLPVRSPQWYTCRLHQAHCLRLAGAFGPALRLYRLLRREAVHRKEALDASVGEALVLRATGQLRRALQLLQSALQSYQQQRDAEGVLYTLWGLGTTLRFAGDFRTAQHYLYQALQLCQRHDLQPLTYLYCALGGLSRMRGAVKRSLTFYNRAHAYALRSNDTFAIAYSACGIANAYRMLQMWDAAEHYFAIARLHYEQIGDRVSYAYTLWGEAMALLLQSRWEEADTQLQTAKTLFQQTGDRRGWLHYVLAFLQLDALRGTQQADFENMLNLALRWGQRYGYRFEFLHLQLLGHLLRGSHGKPLPELWRAYRMCGSTWFRRVPTEKLPVNFP